MHGREERLRTLIEPAVTGLGYELLGVQLVKVGSQSSLLVYIDSEAGISVDDCARVSHQVSGVLDVDDPIAGRYTLEVSSPGSDRPLFTRQHFEQHAGHQIKVKMHVPLDGRRKFRGELKGVEESKVRLMEEGAERLIPLELIRTARLVPEEQMVVRKGTKVETEHE